MVLDTGASGLVIEPSVAEQYGLPTFGDLRIAAVSGKVGGGWYSVMQGVLETCSLCWCSGSTQHACLHCILSLCCAC